MRNFFKKKSTIFFLFNITLLIILFFISLPLYKFLIKNYNSNIKQVSNNEYVKDSIIIDENVESPKILDRKVRIELKAEVDTSLNWNFESIEKNINIKIGENKILNYEGTNLSNKKITGTAEFTVTPEVILPYIIKTECFCFIEQTLEPGGSQIFSMAFYIDPSLVKDSKLNHIENLTFIYRFSELKS